MLFPEELLTRPLLPLTGDTQQPRTNLLKLYLFSDRGFLVLQFPAVLCNYLELGTWRRMWQRRLFLVKTEHTSLVLVLSRQQLISHYYHSVTIVVLMRFLINTTLASCSAHPVSRPLIYGVDCKRERFGTKSCSRQRNVGNLIYFLYLPLFLWRWMNVLPKNQLPHTGRSRTQSFHDTHYYSSYGHGGGWSRKP